RRRSLRARGAGHPGRRGPRGLRRSRPPGLPGRGRRPHPRGHLRAALRRRGQREPGRGERRRHTVLTYFRTGQYYLNRGRAYADFYPEVLARSRDRYWCDYGYHLAPIQVSHIDEMEDLATRQGVPSFKIFMFYGGHGLHGHADRAAQRRFLMVGEDESYDLAHF